MAIRIELAPGFAGMLPEEHDTVWIYTIAPPHLTNHRTVPGELNKIAENWKRAVADLSGHDRYWVKHGGWARKADCQKFINGLKKEYGFQVFKLIKPSRYGVWDQRIEAKNAIKSKSMDW